MAEIINFNKNKANHNQYKGNKFKMRVLDDSHMNSEHDENYFLDRGTEKILKAHSLYDKDAKILKNKLPKKMSAILLDYAQPLLDAIDMPDKKAFESAIKMAYILWNYSVSLYSIDKNMKKLNIENLAQDLFKSKEDRDFLEFMTSRKLSLYPDNHMYIADYNIEWDENAVHLTVISS